MRNRYQSYEEISERDKELSSLPASQRPKASSPKRGLPFKTNYHAFHEQYQKQNSSTKKLRQSFYVGDKLKEDGEWGAARENKYAVQVMKEKKTNESVMLHQNIT